MSYFFALNSGFIVKCLREAQQNSEPPCVAMQGQCEGAKSLAGWCLLESWADGDTFSLRVTVTVLVINCSCSGLLWCMLVLCLLLSFPSPLLALPIFCLVAPPSCTMHERGLQLPWLFCRGRKGIASHIRAPPLLALNKVDIRVICKILSVKTPDL